MRALTQICTITIAALVLAGCESEPIQSVATGDVDPQFVGYYPQDPGATKDDEVGFNAQLVRDAADAFAADNYMAYPMSLVDQNESGKTIVDFLPEGMPLRNPYTGERTEPQVGLADGPGEIGYRIKMYAGSPSGYEINAWGKDAEILFVDNIDELEARTILNGEFVRYAVIQYVADNNGRFPSNMGSDVNLVGKTLTHYLPDGRLMMNPFHLANTEPVNGQAANPGEIGYQPCVQGGFNSGYGISAHGRMETIWNDWNCLPNTNGGLVLQNCWLLANAVDAFVASEGRLPNDINADPTAGGDTVIDLLPGGNMLENPYTLQLTEPRNGVAAGSGHTAYSVIQNNGVVTGYVITGFGDSEQVVNLVKFTGFQVPGGK